MGSQNWYQCKSVTGISRGPRTDPLVQHQRCLNWRVWTSMHSKSSEAIRSLYVKKRVKHKVLRVRGHYTEFCKTRLIKSQRLMISGLLITKLCISHCMVYEKQIMVWSNFMIKPGIHCAIFIRFWAEYWLVRLFFESGQISALSCIICRAVFVQCTGGNEKQLASPDRQSDGRMNFWFWSPLVRVSHNWSKATNRLP